MDCGKGRLHSKLRESGRITYLAAIHFGSQRHHFLQPARWRQTAGSVASRLRDGILHSRMRVISTCIGLISAFAFNEGGPGCAMPPAACVPFPAYFEVTRAVSSLGCNDHVPGSDPAPRAQDIGGFIPFRCFNTEGCTRRLRLTTVLP